MMKYTESGTGYSHSVGYAYDAQNNLTRLEETVNGAGHTTAYTYDEENRILSSTTDGIAVEYDYDDLGRVTTQTTKNGSTVILTESYTYKSPTSTTTSAQIATYTTAVPNGYSVTYSYTYDANGNITSISDGTNTTGYVYDSANQLLRENNQAGGFTYKWTYDDAENILLREEYAYTTGTLGTPTKTVNYTYGNSDWGDLLTQSGTANYTYDANGNIATVSDGTNSTRYLYDTADRLVREDNQDANTSWMWRYDNAGNITGYLTYDYTLGYNYDLAPSGGAQPYYTRWNTYGNSDWGDLLTQSGTAAYTYDAIGNPLSDGTWSYTWKHGRQLTSMVNSSGTTWTYTYDANGMRTARNGSNGVSYTYMYNGGQLMQMTRGTTVYQFTYDANGIPMTISENGTVYYYVTNLQGDVVAILNFGGTEVVRYSYNAWGKKRNISGTMASTLGTYNPLRYRGYVYDQETDLYYLQSRYYNPAIGRFLNADVYISTGQGFVGNNMFAYCLNNPVNYVDRSGTSAAAFQWWTAGMGWLPFIDTVLPVGDVIYFGGILLFGAAALASSENEAPEIFYDEDDAVYGPPTPNDDDDDDDDYYDDDSNFGGRQRVGRNNGSAPGNNQAQNKQFRDATKGLTPGQQRIVHDTITGKGLGYHEIKKIVEAFLGSAICVLIF